MSAQHLRQTPLAVQVLLLARALLLLRALLLCSQEHQPKGRESE
jgi:hypothetical protein